MHTMAAIALFDTGARKAPQLVTVHGWDERSLFVEWADGDRCWWPRYLFDHGYDQFMVPE